MSYICVHAESGCTDQLQACVERPRSSIEASGTPRRRPARRFRPGARRFRPRSVADAADALIIRSKMFRLFFSASYTQRNGLRWSHRVLTLCATCSSSAAATQVPLSPTNPDSLLSTFSPPS